jgi:predicted Rdx family selenoprotein
MSIWSWKQALAESILELANTRSNLAFTIDDIYLLKDKFSALFPSNRHVKEKLRQTLQRLRDDGFLVFLSNGKYRINLAFEDLVDEPAPLRHEGFTLPKTKKVVRSLRLRCTLLASEVKRRYRNTCQVCRTPVVLSVRLFYAEAHHLQPLGAPHLGPDIPGNIIVLCPNHHIMFDRGVATIIPETRMIRHAVPDVFASESLLYVQPWHKLDVRYLGYHYDQIFVDR